MAHITIADKILHTTDSRNEGHQYSLLSAQQDSVTYFNCNTYLFLIYITI
jgi:lipoprotein signal peptidase